VTVDAGNTRQSVEAASTALEHLERSLRQGGFAEGAAAYQRMAEVLVAQSMFTAPSDDELMRRFEQLGRTARRVFELLQPYTLAMRRLTVLAGEDQPDATPAVVDHLKRRGRRGASASVLTRVTRLPQAEVEAALATLVATGEAVNRGGSYILRRQP
jgi:hypothetical protein